jgi:predicted Fe-Mo cluster-binding NifX family protein
VTNENPPEIVASVPTRTEGDLVVGLLQSEGIDALIIADDAGGEIASLQQDGVRVLVKAADADRAREILADLPS